MQQPHPQNLMMRSLCEALLWRHPYLVVAVHMDGVQLPRKYKQRTDVPTIILQIGTDMAIPIPDLIVDDVGVRASLSFVGEKHYVSFPWEAVCVIGTGPMSTDGSIAEGETYVVRNREDVLTVVSPTSAEGRRPCAMLTQLRVQVQEQTQAGPAQSHEPLGPPPAGPGPAEANSSKKWTPRIVR
jgi:stringent starvation protein B